MRRGDDVFRLPASAVSFFLNAQVHHGDPNEGHPVLRFRRSVGIMRR